MLNYHKPHYCWWKMCSLLHVNTDGEDGCSSPIYSELRDNTINLTVKQSVRVNNWPGPEDMSLQTNVNLTFLLEGKKKARKHSLLPQLFEYLSERVLLVFFCFFILERLKWCDISGAVFLTQYKLNLFAPTLFIIGCVIPGWRIASLLFCKPWHYHSCKAA